MYLSEITQGNGFDLPLIMAANTIKKKQKKRGKDWSKGSVDLVQASGEGTPHPPAEVFRGRPTEPGHAGPSGLWAGPGTPRRGSGPLCSSPRDPDWDNWRLMNGWMMWG